MAAPTSRPQKTSTSSAQASPTSQASPTAAKARLASQKVLPQIRDGFSLTLTAHWSKMREGQMRLGQDPRFRKYFNTSVAVKTRKYSHTELSHFLPKRPVAVGETWQISERALLQFFTQFHPNARVNLHNGGPDGAYGCLRAISQRYLEITYRVHMEYALKPGTVFYTPAQFTGRMVLDRKTQKVVFMRIHVPTERTLNVDLNAERAIDIVFVPRMELVGGKEQGWREEKWQHSIPWKDAKLRLAKCFYEFMKIKWHSVAEALAVSRREKKPIHLFVVFGSLDDQSC